MLITLVAGARPNFMKIAPIIKAICEAQKEGHDIRFRLVHTGQHYDQNMSGDFFVQLGIPQPDINLEAGGGSQAEQTAAIMIGFEKELQQNRPDLVIVVGDVNSTLACTITAKKLNVDVAHVEAGIRSGDMTMPEEINRIVTDSICDHFFTTSQWANFNLRNNGVHPSRIHFVGNTMIDSLYENLDRIRQPELWEKHKLTGRNYFLLTLHRPANVDDPQNLSHLIDVITTEANGYPVVFPVHPRTQKNLNKKYFNLPGLILSDPMGYLEFIFLVKNARAVITDSGGITEETTVLNVPCLTLRNSTERPETIDTGTNELVGTDPRNLIPYMRSVKNNNWKKSTIPPLWDGNTSRRIVKKIIELYG